MANISPQSGSTPGSVARFGAFELDLTTGRLRRSGRAVTLQDQQALVLKYLVEHAGATVTREELRKVLWPQGTYVEFEFGLYSTLNRLRRALDDSASSPHYIETVPKQGYRFIAAVELQAASGVQGFGGGDVAPSGVSPPSESVNLPEPVPAPPSQIAAGVKPLPGRPRWWLYGAPVLAAMVLAAAFIAMFVWRFRANQASARQVYRYSIPVPGVGSVGSLAISPAGDEIVYGGPQSLLYRRFLDRSDPRPIRGSEGGRSPFFAPDGKSLGYFTEHELRIVESGGVRTIAVPPQGYQNWNAVWSEDGFVYFSTSNRDSQGIWRAPGTGGKGEQVLGARDSGRGPENLFVNQVLMRPRHLMVYSTNSGPVRRSLHVRDLDTGADKTIVARGIGGQVLPGGQLVYYSRGSLFAVAFDPATLQTSGTPLEMVKDVGGYGFQSGIADVSNTGTLVYVRTEPLRKRLEWVDGNGGVTPLPLPADQYEQAEVSPKGDRLAIVRHEESDRSSLWIWGLDTGGWRHILDSHVPLLRAEWSPDGTELVVSSEMHNEDFSNLYRVPADGQTNIQRLTQEPDFGQFPLSWSTKANAILFMEGRHTLTNGDIMVLPLGGNAVPKRLVATPGWDRSASFSPDGQRFVYESDESGRPEVFVRRWDAKRADGNGPAVKISDSGGSDPIWLPDGQSIYYTDASQRLVQVRLTDGAAPGARRTVYGLVPGNSTRWTRRYSMAPDGRLLILRPVERDAKPAEIQVVVNWAEEIRRSAPVL